MYRYLVRMARFNALASYFMILCPVIHVILHTFVKALCPDTNCNCNSVVLYLNAAVKQITQTSIPLLLMGKAIFMHHNFTFYLTATILLCDFIKRFLLCYMYFSISLLHEYSPFFHPSNYTDVLPPFLLLREQQRLLITLRSGVSGTGSRFRR